MNKLNPIGMEPIGDPPVTFDRPVMEGPLCLSEAELLALEERHDKMLAGAKRIRYHLTECDRGDAKTLADFDELLAYIGIADQVVPQDSTPPTAEMAVVEG